jgi:hypothetical protein
MRTSALTGDVEGVDYGADGGTNMSRTIPAHPDNSPTLDHRMKLYSLAAAAAGVSMLALVQPAESEVIIMNKNIPIPVCEPSYGDPCPVSVDLNNDGIADLKFSIGTNFGASGGYSFLRVKGIAGNEVVANRGYVSALMRSAKIGPSAHFEGKAGEFYLMEGEGCVEGSCEPPNGKWGGNHPNRFVGVKFKINGATHYGWVRVTVTTSTPDRYFVSGTITEYGYETIANKVVLAGLASTDVANDETSESNAGPSLGALALGADGLVLWRREEALVH